MSAGAIALVTTAIKQRLDQALSLADREQIWQRCMPREAPLADDIDWHFLARRIDMTGGQIRQITLRAAFAAATQGAPIGMDHLLRATRAEAIKLGMPALERELAEQVNQARRIARAEPANATKPAGPVETVDLFKHEALA